MEDIELKWIVSNNINFLKNPVIIQNNDTTGDDFVLEIQPSATDDDTTKLTQNTINTKDITARNATMSNKTKTKTLEVSENAAITKDITI